MNHVIAILRFGLGVLLILLIGSGAEVGELELSDQARIRLTCRLNQTNTEQCRTLTGAELQAQPIHMRLKEECVRTPVTYRLWLRVDGATMVDTSLTAPGIHQDRPIYCGEEISLPPGQHQIDAELYPLEITAFSGHRFSEVADLAPGQIMLIDATDDGFEAKQGR